MDADPLHRARLDRIRLRVRNSARAAAFYRELLAFDVREPGGPGTVLSFARSDDAPFRLLLEEDPDAIPAPSPSVGLYHFALLYPDRGSLGRAVRRVVDAGWDRIDGAADHGVSEAFYLRDPEGNGIELYRDRPREAWPESGDEVEMTTEPLDVDALLEDAAGGDATTPPPVLGHLHLHVGDMEASRTFYVEIVGLRIRQSGYPGALFLAAGDYHHHLGLNVWARGRTPPPGAGGLVGYRWRMPPEDARAAIERARNAGVGVRADGSGEGTDGERILEDPDGIRVAVAPEDFR